MADEPVISVQHVGKCFRMYAQPQDRLKQMLFRRFGPLDVDLPIIGQGTW